MALHLIKLAVGIDDFRALARVQKLRRKERGKACFFTRHMPRRSAELLDGGSIYWVIKGHIQARQLLRGFEAVEDADERYCAVRYDPKLVETQWQPRRAFQGWRYLEAKDVPPDRAKGARAEEDALPPAMLRELRSLGLL